jgi:hypothetical protein
MKENRRLTLNEYASKRGFTKQELQQYDIRLEGDVVVIPTLGRNGAWYEREHRPDGVPKYKTPQGETIHLYNPLGLGPNTDEVWIAEGEFDTLSLVVSGVPAVGLSGATSWNEKWWLLYARARVVSGLLMIGLVFRGRCSNGETPHARIMGQRLQGEEMF